MNSNEYVIKAHRTLSDKFYPDLVLPNFLHGVMGMVTEAGELLGKKDRVNAIEELGDFTWYLAIASKSVNHNLEDLPKPTNYQDFDEASKRLSEMSSELLDLIKKAFFYGKEIDYNAVGMFLSGINSVVEDLILICKTSRSQVYQINIDKLKARFPDKFTEERAINRDLDAERQVLEEGVAA